HGRANHGHHSLTHQGTSGQRRIPESLGTRRRTGRRRCNSASARRSSHNQSPVIAMLSQLTIRNFAIVDHLQIDWHPGLNVITGETGAGKSILIDAVGALLGDHLGPEVVRSGATRALIEGVFIVASAEPPADLRALLDEYGPG